MIPSDVAARLFGAPLEDFIPTRNALAAELKDAGDAESAAEVKKAKKPTVSAWAVNQLSRKHPKELSRLFEVRDEIADAESPADMRRAGEERRKIIVGLIAAAEKILEGAGRGASSSVTEKITQTLQAGDTDEERDAILGGRLERDLVPTGFSGFGGFSGFTGEDEVEEEDDSEAAAEEETRRRVAALVAEAEEAEQEADAAEAAAEEAEQEARRVRRGAKEARARATKARAKAERAK
jgi:hypothetical protein